jgi:hypothetical protein
MPAEPTVESVVRRGLAPVWRSRVTPPASSKTKLIKTSRFCLTKWQMKHFPHMRKQLSPYRREGREPNIAEAHHQGVCPLLPRRFNELALNFTKQTPSNPNRRVPPAVGSSIAPYAIAKALDRLSPNALNPSFVHEENVTSGRRQQHETVPKPDILNTSFSSPFSAKLHPLRAADPITLNELCVHSSRIFV